MKSGSTHYRRDRLAPFPFSSMFQNGPRRQGFAPENLFKPAKDPPPPRTNRAPLPAPGRSENFPMRRERGQTQRPNHPEFAASCCLPMVGPPPTQFESPLSSNPKIRSPPVDDVNNLRHDDKCQRCPSFDGYSDRRNALFTSPECARRCAATSFMPSIGPRRSYSSCQRLSSAFCCAPFRLAAICRSCFFSSAVKSLLTFLE